MLRYWIYFGNSLKRKKRIDFLLPKGNGLCTDLEYTVERLVKGIGSLRKAARHGFTLALTEVLRLFPSVSTDHVICLIKKHLLLSGTKQEKGSATIGQLLAYGAIIRSGRVSEEPDTLGTLVFSLQNLAAQRSYVQHAAFKLLKELFVMVDEKSFSKHILPQVKDSLCGGWNNCTPDKLWLLFVCARLFPGIINQAFLKEHWKTEHLLSSENYTHLVRIFKQSTASHPLVHLACHEVVTQAVKDKDFTLFWKTVVDDGLFNSHLNEKTYLGFQLIKVVLSRIKKAKKVQYVLSQPFCNIFIKASMWSQHPLNPAVCEMSDFLISFVKECSDPAVQFAVLKVYIQPPGTIMFDQVTKKKTLATLLQDLLPGALKKYVTLLKEVVLGHSFSENKKPDGDQIRINAVRQIAIAVGQIKLREDMEWKKEILQFLLLHSLFEVTQISLEVPQCSQNVASMSPIIHQACQQSFLKALDIVLRNYLGKNKLHKQAEIMNFLSDYLQTLLNSTEVVKPVMELVEIHNLWTKTVSLVSKLKKRRSELDSGSTDHLCVFEVFLLHLGLQLFLDSKRTAGPLEDLYECCKRALKAQDRPDNFASEEPQWTEVIIEVILSLLSEASHSTRSMLTFVFSHLCPILTKESLQQILNVINPEKATEEDGPLIEEEDDVEFESASSDEEDRDSTVDEGFRQRIQEALGNAVDKSDNESETYLSDSEMFKLDDALSKAFRSQIRKSNKKPSKEEQSLLHFRIRCLDLIITFLKSEPSLSLVLQTILPLVSAAEFGLQHNYQQPLSVKAKQALKVLNHVRKFSTTEGVDRNTCLEILSELLAKTGKVTEPELSQILGSLAVYVVLSEKRTNSTASNKKEEKWFVPVFQQALQEFCTENVPHHRPQLFSSLTNAIPEVIWDFVPIMQTYGFSPDVRIFRRAQILGILTTGLRHSKGTSVKQSKLLKIGKELVSCVVKVLEEIKDGTEIKPLFTTELLDLLLVVGNMVEEKCGEYPLQDHPNLLSILTGISGKERKRLERRGHHTWRKLVAKLGGKPSIQPKQTSNKEPERRESETLKRKSDIKMNSNTDVGSPSKRSKENPEVKENNSSLEKSQNETGDQMATDNVNTSVIRERQNKEFPLGVLTVINRCNQ
ncbi:MYB binding protein 1a isoform X2 [Tachypleus tridentatus]|uniref:MYB binding protein 1a isoform X2 n=1 Tax=Tachypleus tridentatus TaxID=6853 RepID=UPI003FD173BF